MSSLKNSNTTITDLYKGLEVITQLLKDIKNSVKDDPATNKKIKEAFETLAKISTQTFEILSLVRSFDFSTLLSIVKHIQDHAFKQEEASSVWIKSSTNMAWNLDASIGFIGLATHPTITMAQPITIIHPEPSFPQRKGKEYWDKDEKIKKAEEEAKLNAISKIEVIKVVRKEAKKIGIHPKEAISSKADELREIIPKKKNTMVKDLMNSLSRRHERVFGISKIDELREIIPKKKNTMVKDLMNSLSRRHERLRQIPSELGIQSALPAPGQASSQTSGRKQKHMELKPETRIPGLECNRALSENVPFINNMVIEEPEYGIFFTDEFGDQAFQRWSDINKVGMEALVSYLVAASMVKSLENARFSMKQRKLIAEHLDQEKLKSKKVKLEALGYKWTEYVCEGSIPKDVIDTGEGLIPMDVFDLSKKIKKIKKMKSREDEFQKVDEDYESDDDASDEDASDEDASDKHESDED
nr:hypothetical protein [Tanacetum cinerariifolium]